MGIRDSLPGEICKDGDRNQPEEEGESSLEEQHREQSPGSRSPCAAWPGRSWCSLEAEFLLWETSVFVFGFDLIEAHS